MLELCCPNCKQKIVQIDSEFSCKSCDFTFPKRHGIPDFRKSEAYWCHISKADMTSFLKDVEQVGYQEAQKSFPKNNHWLFKDVPNRSDGTFFMDVDESSLGIDIGCGWGGLLILLAQRFSRMVGVDKTIETLALTRCKAIEKKITNIDLFSADAKSLPFQEGQFDFAVMNGFLEWSAEEGDWSQGSIFGTQTNKSPRDLQIQTLKEAWRVLKPKGKLYLAIENRWGYTYFLGNPDPHVGKWGYNLLPKKMANIISKIFLKRPYSTYIYSLRELKAILKKSGFSVKQEYTAFDDYEQPNTILPLDKKPLPLFKHYFKHFRFKQMHWVKKLLWQSIIKTGLILKIVPCFILVAEKDA